MPSRLLNMAGPGSPDVVLHAALPADEETPAVPRPGSFPSSLDARYYDSENDVVDGLRRTLAKARMGLRLYVAGPETFLWMVTNLAYGFGVAREQVRRELIGSAARRVYCVHCRTIFDGARTSLEACPGCGRTLLVRDHFSRALGAYMGVQADAEEPGALPGEVEAFA